jgi:hypothetical protein
MGLPIYWIKSMADSRYEQLKGQLSDPRWRLNNLYWIMDKTGKKIPFRLNWAQEELLTNLHHCNLILKARQLGFTTAIQIFLLDQALFNSNVRCGTIAHRLDDAKTIFRDKVRFPYDHLPEGIRSARSLVSDSAEDCCSQTTAASALARRCDRARCNIYISVNMVLFARCILTKQARFALVA